MKRLFFLSSALFLFLLIPSEKAYAICQMCDGNNTLDAMCVTLGPCDRWATMGACVVMERYDSNGEVTSRYCDSMGSRPSVNCNGNSPTCTGQGTECNIGWFDECPAECLLCWIQSDPWS
ncbi:MAG TPA: hypothetical protein VHW00_04710 [Thermoanaerobaculia bacterium]|nr:hypothetical protein [Thermoanaerobaculia bacterium]